MKILTVLLILLVAFWGCKKNEDKCPDCQNGATCINNVCQCIGLWTGPNCSEQINPSLITFNRIRIDKFPATDNGASWDIGSGPDLYIKVYRNNTLVYTSANFVQNGTVGTIMPAPVNIQGPATALVQIELWDYDDFDNDDFIGSFNGYLYDSKNKFPKTINLDCLNCTVAFTLYEVQYL